MPRNFANLPKFEVLGRIGRGAGAIIYRGRDLTQNRPVAIKHVVRRGPEQDKFIQQAETEYDIAHRLDHPALRKYYAIHRVRRWLKTRELFLIMELIEGETLEAQRKNLPPPEEFDDILPIFRQVAEGLHSMHQQGFVHADIKPNNILLTPNGAKIIDFGQSCPIGHIKQRVQGTPDYIAPEQVQRGPLDRRTDVFNFGATMYWVVTGKWFRTMLNVGELAAKKIEIDARSGSEPPDDINPAVSVALSRLIMECCEPRPSDRPSDMKQVASRLELIEHMLRKRGKAATRRR